MPCVKYSWIHLFPVKKLVKVLVYFLSMAQRRIVNEKIMQTQQTPMVSIMFSLLQVDRERSSL